MPADLRLILQRRKQSQHSLQQIFARESAPAYQQSICSYAYILKAVPLDGSQVHSLFQDSDSERKWSHSRNTATSLCPPMRCIFGRSAGPPVSSRATVILLTPTIRQQPYRSPRTRSDFGSRMNRSRSARQTFGATSMLDCQSSCSTPPPHQHKALANVAAMICKACHFVRSDPPI